MRVLAIGSDRSLLSKESESAKRQIAYGERFGALDIIVFSKKGSCNPMRLSEKVQVYPTASRSRLLYGVNALHIARSLPKPNVITAQDPFEAGLIALILARLLHTPLHVQIHTDLYDPAFARHSFINRIRLIIAHIVLARASGIRAVSHRIKHSLLATGFQLPPISILPIFVDTERFRNAHAGSLAERFATYTWKVLVVSRLETEKNVSLAIESFNTAAPDNACLIIVGEGSQRANLEYIAGKHVFFEGSQNPAPYYALADLVLVTSKYEGYGLTIVEALAAGKPVLATDVGIAREVGAVVTSEEKYGEALRKWFAHGPFKGEFAYETYRSFDDYVGHYYADISACVTE